MKVLSTLTGLCLLFSTCANKEDNNTTESNQQKFKVGDKIEVQWAGFLYPGKIVGYNKSKGCYEVEYENKAYKNSCEFPEKIKLSGKNLEEPFTLKATDTYGTWGIGTTSRTTTQDNTTQTTTTNLYGGGSLTINANKTYTWKINSKETVTGKWDTNAAPERYKGPVRLIKGMFGKDWWVNYEGKNNLGKPTIYIRSAEGTRYWGFK